MRPRHAAALGAFDGVRTGGPPPSAGSPPPPRVELPGLAVEDAAGGRLTRDARRGKAVVVAFLGGQRAAAARPRVRPRRRLRLDAARCADPAPDALAHDLGEALG